FRTAGGRIQRLDELLESGAVGLELVELLREPPGAVHDGAERGEQQEVECQPDMLRHQTSSSAGGSMYSSMLAAICPCFWPTFAMNIGCWPTRISIRSSGWVLRMTVDPTFQFRSSVSGTVVSPRMAERYTSVWNSSRVRCDSQMVSRPNFSPMNICSRISRTGSSVA